jgi:preprotein translocase subunit SecG
METVILVLHVLTAVSVIGLVLMQHGKGADMGAAFGSGTAGSLFGSSGSANFLSRATALLAAVFFATSLALTYFSYQHGTKSGVMDRQVIEQKSAPTTAAPQAPSAAPKPADSTDSKAKEIPK